MGKTILDMSYPKVSIIVPVFNDQEGLENCVRALTQQNYPRECLEILVVDNGSTPKLTLGDHGGMVQLLECPTPGAYSARNAGVAKATGDVYAFIDADCRPEISWVAEGVRHLISTAPTGIAGGEVIMLPPSRRNGISLYQYETGFLQRENIERKRFSATANMFCWKHQFELVGGFDSSLFSGADREWGLRASAQGFRIEYCPRAKVHTSPRSTLQGAIRQARRVTAGRMQLAAKKLDWVGLREIESHRSGVRALVWILTRGRLTLWERMQVLAAAIAIRLATGLEQLRLRFGGNPERR